MSWAALASFAAPVIGNMIGSQQNASSQDEANKINREQDQQNIAMQKEFAQHGVRWKVEDAKRAGINPLVALGGSTHSFSPVSVGAESSRPGDMAVNMGQDISRAIQATRTQNERQLVNLQLANAQADLDGKVIDNQIRASQLQKMNQTGPPMPSAMDTGYISGQGNSVKVKPSEVYASESSRPGIQSGMINTLQYTREANGNISIAPSTDMKERMEDDFIAEGMWHMKNRMLPPSPSTKDYPIPAQLRSKGYKYWFWHPLKQEFVPSKNP